MALPSPPTAPLSKLHVEAPAGKAAVYGNAPGGSSIGVVGEATAATSAGVLGRNPTGAAVHADGNATQARDKGGFVKAMAYIDPFLPADQYVVRCYNSQQAGETASTAPCGIQVFRTGRGTYTIDFGFKVADRFVSLTSQGDYGGEYGLAVGTISSATGNRITVSFSQIGNEQTGVDTAFHIIVY